MQSYVSGPIEAARRYWQMSLVRGVIAIIFGLLAIFWPHLTVKIFFIVFGVFAVIEGCLLISSAFAQKRANSQENASYQQENPYRRDASYQAEIQHQRNTFSQREDAYQAENAHQRDPAYQAEYGARPTNWMLLVGQGVLSIICGLLCIFLPTAMAVVALYVVAVWALIEGVGAIMQVRTRGWIMGVIGILAIILAIVLFFNPLGAIRSFLWAVGVFALIAGILMILWGLYQNVRTNSL